jgi:hypothetical protein
MIFSAQRAAASPTLLRSTTTIRQSLMGRNKSPLARVARRQCVFNPLTLDHPFSRTKLTPNTQVFACIISLLNDFLLARDEPPLGFLNPWLYGDGQAGLNDITSGSDQGCSTNGFPAVVGWDPVRSARLVSLHFSTLADSGLNR